MSTMPKPRDWERYCVKMDQSVNPRSPLAELAECSSAPKKCDRADKSAKFKSGLELIGFGVLALFVPIPRRNVERAPSGQWSHHSTPSADLQLGHSSQAVQSARFCCFNRIQLRTILPYLDLCFHRWYVEKILELMLEVLPVPQSLVYTCKYGLGNLWVISDTHVKQMGISIRYNRGVVQEYLACSAAHAWESLWGIGGCEGGRDAFKLRSWNPKSMHTAGD